MIQPSSFHSAASVVGGSVLPCSSWPALADRQLLPFDGEPGARRRGFHHLDGLGHDFEPDVVAQQDSNFQAGVSSDGVRGKDFGRKRAS